MMGARFMIDHGDCRLTGGDTRAMVYLRWGGEVTASRPGNPNHLRLPTMSTISHAAANRLYAAGNYQGLGYAPYTDVPGPDTIDAAVNAAIADGWTVVHARKTSSEVAVLADEDGAVLAIGGDASGNGAWAVALIDSDGSVCPRGVDRDGNVVEVQS